MQVDPARVLYHFGGFRVSIGKMRSLGLVSLVVASLTGCGKAPMDSPLEALLKRTRLKERVRVDFAIPIDSSSFLLTLHEDGSVSRDGKGVSLDRIREIVSGPKGETGGGEKLNTAPILIEAHPDTRLRAVRDLLMALVEKGRVNIVFLAETEMGSGGVTFPVLGERGLNLHFSDGAFRFDDRSTEWRRRTWVEVEAGKEGVIRLKSLRSRLIVEEYPNPLGVGAPKALSPEERLLEERGRDLPAWDFETIRRFFREPPIAGDDPRLQLKISANLNVRDFLRAVSRLRAAAGEHSVAECGITGD